MRCLVCESWSFSHMCQSCQTTYLVPNPHIRVLECGLKVLSFFAYDEIDFLLKTKHQDLGFYIYKILAKKTMPAFAKAFNYDKQLTIIPIDDKVKESYAHTAILANALKSSKLNVSFGALHARHDISYSGQSLAFRLANPREFIVKKIPKHDVLLVDDIVTTGSTLCEAKKVLDYGKNDTLMAVVLADASR